MRTVNVHEAKTTLSALLVEVEERGEVVVICRNGRPVAELRRLSPRTSRLEPHPDARHVVLHEDGMAPLGPEEWGELT